MFLSKNTYRRADRIMNEKHDKKDKILNTARRYKKRGFKSEAYRRAYWGNCNTVELVHPDTFKRMVLGVPVNAVQRDAFKAMKNENDKIVRFIKSYVKTYSICLLYTSPSPRDKRQSRMPSSA